MRHVNKAVDGKQIRESRSSERVFRFGFLLPRPSHVQRADPNVMAPSRSRARAPTSELCFLFCCGMQDIRLKIGCNGPPTEAALKDDRADLFHSARHRQKSHQQSSRSGHYAMDGFAIAADPQKPVLAEIFGQSEMKSKTDEKRREKGSTLIN